MILEQRYHVRTNRTEDHTAESKVTVKSAWSGEINELSNVIYVFIHILIIIWF